MAGLRPSNSAPHFHDAGLSSGVIAGRFVIRACLGKGAMGEVYRADDTKLHRTVAIKRLAPDLREDPEQRQRFLREAERISQFTDAHIAALYDVVEDEPDLFLVMEYVEGITLRDRQRLPMSIDDFLRLACQCAESLIAAHEQGLVHCDIKPENIMLAHGEQVKLLDFGLARHLPRFGLDSTLESQPSIVGTPGYMAPEVLQQKIPDARADIFSLGVVFYECLAGHHPFLSGSFMATYHRILQETPPPLRIFNIDVSDDLQFVIAKTLEKDVGHRYASARDLLQDLQAVRMGMPLAGLAAMKRLHEPVLSRRAMVNTVMLVLLTAAALTGWHFIPRHGRPRLPQGRLQIAVLPFTTNTDNSGMKAFSDGLTETLTAKLAQVRGEYRLDVVPATEIRAGPVTTAGQANREFGVNLVLEGSLHAVGDKVRVTYGLIDARSLRQLRANALTANLGDSLAVEDQVIDGVLEMLGVELGPKDRALITSHSTDNPQAHDFYLRGLGYLQEAHLAGNLANAVLVFHRALDLDPKYALAHAGLGLTFWHQYNLTHDRTLVASAITSCAQAVKLAPELSIAHACLGSVYDGTGEYGRAVEEFERAVQLDSTNDTAVLGLAEAYEKFGEPGKTEAIYKRAIALRPQASAGYNMLGKYYYVQVRYADAARMFSHVVELAPDSYRGYNNLAGTYLTLGRYADAIPLLERSAAIKPTAYAYSNLGTAYFYQHKYEQALHAYEQSVKLPESDYQVWGNLAEAYRLAGSPATNAALGEAKRRAEDQLQVNPRDTVALYHLAWFSAMAGQRANAFHRLQQARALDSNDRELWFKTAKIYNLFGQTSAALDSLEKAAGRGCTREWIRDDPWFINLASEARFQKLITAM